MTIELAGGVVSDNDGRLLLIHRNTPELVQWELPGGRVEVTRGEAPAEAVNRELREELGVEVRVGAELGAADFDQNGQMYRYRWLAATLIRGRPYPQESTHDDWGYFWASQMRHLDNLSPNMRNLLKKIDDGEIRL